MKAIFANGIHTTFGGDSKCRFLQMHLSSLATHVACRSVFCFTHSTTHNNNVKTRVRSASVPVSRVNTATSCGQSHWYKLSDPWLDSVIVWNDGCPFLMLLWKATSPAYVMTDACIVTTTTPSRLVAVVVAWVLNGRPVLLPWGGELGLWQCLGGWYGSSVIHLNARTPSLPAEHCIVTKLPMLFTSAMFPFNVVADEWMLCWKD